jgi:hypothetical protein
VAVQVAEGQTLWGQLAGPKVADPVAVGKLAGPKAANRSRG